MQTKNLIQASANVVKITRLTVGDTLKVVEDSSYGDPKVFLGVVTDILNNGENTFVQVMQYEVGFGSVECKIKTYSGTKDVSIFPASPEELKENLSDAISNMERKISEEEKSLEQKKFGLQRAKEFVSGEMQKKLTASSFKEMTQEQYNQLKIEMG